MPRAGYERCALYLRRSFGGTWFGSRTGDAANEPDCGGCELAGSPENRGAVKSGTVWDLADRDEREFLAAYIAAHPERSATTREFGLPPLACPRCEAPLSIVRPNEHWRGYLECRECWLAFSFCSGRLEQGRFRPPGFRVPEEEDEPCLSSAIAGKENAPNTLATILEKMEKPRSRAAVRLARCSSISGRRTEGC